MDQYEQLAAALARALSRVGNQRVGAHGPATPPSASADLSG